MGETFWMLGFSNLTVESLLLAGTKRDVDMSYSCVATSLFLSLSHLSSSGQAHPDPNKTFWLYNYPGNNMHDMFPEDGVAWNVLRTHQMSTFCSCAVAIPMIKGTSASATYSTPATAPSHPMSGTLMLWMSHLIDVRSPQIWNHCVMVHSCKCDHIASVTCLQLIEYHNNRSAGDRRNHD